MYSLLCPHLICNGAFPSTGMHFHVAVWHDVNFLVSILANILSRKKLEKTDFFFTYIYINICPPPETLIVYGEREK